MQPLNGKCAMTREEANARRRELDKNPFHHALTLKTAKKSRERNREKNNAKRRAKYAENREAELERGRKWRKENPEKARASHRKWRAKNLPHLHAKDRARYADPEKRAHDKEVRRIRESTPEGRAKANAYKRLHYHRTKYTDAGIAWKVKYLLEPRWRKLITESDEAVERYERRCTVQTWSLFVKWARERGRFLDPQKRGRKR